MLYCQTHTHPGVWVRRGCRNVYLPKYTQSGTICIIKARYRMSWSGPKSCWCKCPSKSQLQESPRCLSNRNSNSIVQNHFEEIDMQQILQISCKMTSIWQCSFKFPNMNFSPKMAHFVMIITNHASLLEMRGEMFVRECLRPVTSRSYT